MLTEESMRTRNVCGFWLLGLFNNFSYVIMLSAAHDLLKDNGVNTSLPIPNSTNQRDCNTLSTGTILLADIIPAILVKAVSPFLSIGIHTKVITAALLSGLSFLLVSIATNHTTTYVGVIAASASSGLGEVSFLAYSHFFQENVISSWSSGTGGAGVIGAGSHFCMLYSINHASNIHEGSYAALTAMGLSPQTTVMVMLVVPIGMLLTFFGLLSPNRVQHSEDDEEPLIEDTEAEDVQTNDVLSRDVKMSLNEKLSCFRSLLWRFMIPLGMVYLFEYLINQGLYELMLFPGAVSWIDHGQQYRCYQLIYQVGVLISRSSLSVITVKRIKVLSFLQGLNLILLVLQTIFWVLPLNFGIFIIFLAIFWEGLLGGAAYVNTFHRISVESSDREREFSLGISSLADSVAIGIAGFLALPLHNWICSLPVI